jgi:hypothetical protein
LCVSELRSLFVLFRGQIRHFSCPCRVQVRGLWASILPRDSQCLSVRPCGADDELSAQVRARCAPGGRVVVPGAPPLLSHESGKGVVTLPDHPFTIRPIF